MSILSVEPIHFASYLVCCVRTLKVCNSEHSTLIPIAQRSMSIKGHRCKNTNVVLYKLYLSTLQVKASCNEHKWCVCVCVCLTRHPIYLLNYYISTNMSVGRTIRPFLTNLPIRSYIEITNLFTCLLDQTKKYRDRCFA